MTSERHKDDVWLCLDSLAIAAEARIVEGDSTATPAGEEDEVDTSSALEPSNDDDGASSLGAGTAGRDWTSRLLKACT